MAILGITNRTENWKTACHFAPLFGHGSVRVARQLLTTDEERAKLHPGDVSLELFWRGLRDHFDLTGKKYEAEKETLAREYRRLFRNLRKEIQTYADTHPDRFQEPAPNNYNTRTSEQKSGLASNLFHTEVDIVLESPSHLFIGEAKHLSNLGADSRHVLTHQLIRQYVMARILVQISGRNVEVVPFVVGDSRKTLAKYGQIRFMIKQGWLREANILQWSDIEALW